VKKKKQVTKEENALRLKLYNEGLNDREIAYKLNLSKSAIFRWRKVNNLPANVNKGNLSIREVEKRIELINKGLGDKEIADILGINPKTFTNWRCNRGIRGNKKYETIKLTKSEHNRRMELYKKGMDDSEISKELGLSRECIRKWRERNNLPPNKERGGQPIELNFDYSWELGYLVGLTCGDGYVYKYKNKNTNNVTYGLTFTSSLIMFIDHIEKLINLLFPQLKTSRCSYYSDSDIYGRKYPHKKFYVVRVFSKQLYNFITKFKKEGDKWIIPFNYPDEFKYGFIGGIVDADGTVTRYYVRIVNKHRENLSNMKKLMRELGFIYGNIRISERMRDGNSICRLEMSGNKNLRLLLDKCKIPYRSHKLKKLLGAVNTGYTEEDYNRVMELRKREGIGKRLIAKKTGLPLGIVGQWLYAGVKPRCIRLADKYGK